MKKKFVLQWHLTHKCNLRCKHCYLDEYKNDMDLNTMEDLIVQFNDFIQKNNFRGHINFTGGEPLLVYDKLKILMNFCEENNISFGILTNGTLITDEIARELSTYKKLSFVQMSLEGRKKTNDDIRGKGTYNKVFKSVRLLNKHKMQTMISFTVHKNNMQDLNRLILACRLHGVKRFWTDRLIPSTNSDDSNLLLLSTEEYGEFTSKLYKHSKCRLGGTNVECKRSMQGLVYLDCDGYKCSAGDTLVALTANGDLMLCRRLPVEVGNVRNNSLEDLIKLAKQRRAELESGNNECDNCFLRHKCNNGLRCLTYVQTGNFVGRDINCWIYTQDKPIYF